MYLRVRRRRRLIPSPPAGQRCTIALNFGYPIHSAFSPMGKSLIIHLVRLNTNIDKQLVWMKPVQNGSVVSCDGAFNN
jgi:hypothetical protein